MWHLIIYSLFLNIIVIFTFVQQEKKRVEIAVRTSWFIGIGIIGMILTSLLLNLVLEGLCETWP